MVLSLRCSVFSIHVHSDCGLCLTVTNSPRICLPYNIFQKDRKIFQNRQALTRIGWSIQRSISTSNPIFYSITVNPMKDLRSNRHYFITQSYFSRSAHGLNKPHHCTKWKSKLKMKCYTMKNKTLKFSSRKIITLTTRSQYI